MISHQGKVHNYFGMTLDYTEGGTFKFIMIDYIDEIIAVFYKVDLRGCGIKNITAPEDL